MFQFNWGVFWAVLAALCLFGLGFLFVLLNELETGQQNVHKLLYKIESTVERIREELQRLNADGNSDRLYQIAQTVGRIREELVAYLDGWGKKRQGPD